MRVTFWAKHPIRVRLPGGQYRFHTNLTVAQSGLLRPVTEVAQWDNAIGKYVVMEEK